MTMQTTGGKHAFAWPRLVSCALIAVAPLTVWFGVPAEAANFSRGSETAKTFGVHEIVLTGNGLVANPFDTGATGATVVFTPPSGVEGEVAVKAFFDGENTWRARLYVSESGQWRWWSHSEDDEKLNGGSGSFTAVRSNLRGKLRSHPKNKRWWVTDDGRTFLNLADTVCILFRSPNDPTQPVTDNTFQRYVKANRRLGVTSMRAGGCGGYAGWSRFVRGVMPSYCRSNWCWQKDYTAKGSNRYWERFDLDRFQTTDRRLQWLLDNDPEMYIQLIMGSKEGSKWFKIPQPHRERTVEYMIARWSAWPQVYYQIVNDTLYTGSQGETNQAMVREIAGLMTQMEPFGTFRSAGAKRDADNPFTLEKDWDFGISQHPGFMESADFRLLATSPSGQFFNFADSDERNDGEALVLLAWFAAKTGDAIYLDEGFFRKPDKAGRLAGLGLIWLSQFSETKKSELPLKWHGLGRNPVAFFRGEKNDLRQFYLAVKGGSALISHGNIDAGSFVFDLSGVRWGIDPGNQNYYLLNKIGFELSNYTQGSERWSLLTKGNHGHSTITVNNARSKVKGYAPITNFKSADPAEVTIDMSDVLEGETSSSTKT